MLPSRLDINPVPEDLDSKCAEENLFGKSPEEAFELLCQNSSYYSADFIWMGAKAFEFYFDALVMYLESKHSNQDMEFAYFMLATFKVRLQENSQDIIRTIPKMLNFCQIITNDFERLGFDENYKKRFFRRYKESQNEISIHQEPLSHT